jgi:pyruvate dehydrogenase E1 component
LQYSESEQGQILEEGITEAGAMASFTAAATSYSTWSRPMLPFFLYYSMFGFQRIGDLIWAAGDMRCRGFLLGGTAGRTTLAGEGLQHQDGNSHLNALAFPTVMAYDPCYAYELSVIVLDGIRKMYYEDQDIFYYITLMNENYDMPILPLGSTEGICKGIYRLSERRLGPQHPHVTLFGSGAILREALRAQDLLEQKFGVGSSVYSVTSYKNLYYDGRDCDRWNRLHPGAARRQPFVEQVLGGDAGPIVAASDYIAAVPQAVGPWVGPDYTVLGTDGYGRSEARSDLRRFFEVDAENIVLTALERLARKGEYPKANLCEAIKTLGLDPNKPNQVGR